MGVSRRTSAMRASIGSACGPIRSASDVNRIACGQLMNEAPWLQPHVEAVLLQAGRAGGSAGIQEPRYRASHGPVELARRWPCLNGCRGPSLSCGANRSRAEAGQALRGDGHEENQQDRQHIRIADHPATALAVLSREIVLGAHDHRTPASCAVMSAGFPPLSASRRKRLKRWRTSAG